MILNYKFQRVGLFIDTQNIYHSAKNLYGARVNFRKILEEGSRGRQLIRAIAYVIRSKSFEEESFFEALAKQGFEIKLKDLQIFYGGAKKADWDVGIAIDAVKLAEKIDVVVLVTGDGDFVPLVNYLKENKGCRVEVMAFKETTSAKLIEMADEFIDLSQQKRKFLIRKYE
ncbi:MAG: NYN domain-containing protein [Patescibacteria group bacterium]|nr:NYN domain-containing protein [Patescibacteria group bacterium]